MNRIFRWLPPLNNAGQEPPEVSAASQREDLEIDTGSDATTFSYEGAISPLLDAQANVKEDASAGSTEDGLSYSWEGRGPDGALASQYGRARYFDPETGRWLSVDPPAPDPGEANLYPYPKPPDDDGKEAP